MPKSLLELQMPIIPSKFKNHFPLASTTCLLQFTQLSAYINILDSRKQRTVKEKYHLEFFFSLSLSLSFFFLPISWQIIYSFGEIKHHSKFLRK